MTFPQDREFQLGGTQQTLYKPPVRERRAVASATFWTRTWQRYGFSHHLPRRFGWVCGQCRARSPYLVYKLRCREAGRFIGEYVVENCPIGDGQSWSGFNCTGLFVARLIS